MTAFSEERAPSRPLGRWDSLAMAEVRGIREKAVGFAGHLYPDPRDRKRLAVRGVSHLFPRSLL